MFWVKNRTRYSGISSTSNFLESFSATVDEYLEEKVLIQKVIELTPILVETTADDINYLFDKAKDFNLKLKGERLEAFFDLLILKIKLADGFANLYLREESRGFFTNSLIVAAGKMLTVCRRMIRTHP